MPRRLPGAMRSGAHPFPGMLVICAPICVSGSMILFMGREFRDSSPESLDPKDCPARMPERRRVVVPLLPTSSISFGADSPWSPLPWTMTEEFFSSISIPSARKHRIVARQSAPWRKLRISVVPSAIEPNIIHLCEIDLSPGTEILPFSPVKLHNSICISSFCGLFYVSYTI